MTVTGHFSECLSTLLLKKGRQKNTVKKQLDKRYLQGIDEFYLGNGWYIDGLHGQKDYYIGFAFHF